MQHISVLFLDLNDTEGLTNKGAGKLSNAVKEGDHMMYSVTQGFEVLHHLWSSMDCATVYGFGPDDQEAFLLEVL